MRATDEMIQVFNGTYSRVESFGGPAHYPALPTESGQVVSVSLAVYENPRRIKMREVYASRIGARATHDNVTIVALENGEMSVTSLGSNMSAPANLIGEGVVEATLRDVTSQPPGFNLVRES